MQPVEQQRQPAGRGLGGVPGGARDDQHRRRREQRAARRDQLGHRPSRAVGAVEPQRDAAPRRRTARSTAPDRPSPARTRSPGTAARARPRRIPSAASRSRSRRRGTPGSRSGRAPTRPRTRPTALAASLPRTARTTGRATSNRSTNRPIAAITNRNIAHRVISSCGVVAVAGDVRDPELGRRPRVGSDRVGEEPVDRVTVDRDRPPVDRGTTPRADSAAAARRACPGPTAIGARAPSSPGARRRWSPR